MWPNEECVFFHSHPGYFGKVGMRHYHLKKNQKFCPTVNLDKLWTLVTEQTRLNYAKNQAGLAPVIDVVRSVSFCSGSNLQFLLTWSVTLSFARPSNKMVSYRYACAAAYLQTSQYKFMFLSISVVKLVLKLCFFFPVKIAYFCKVVKIVENITRSRYENTIELFSLLQSCFWFRE